MNFFAVLVLDGKKNFFSGSEMRRGESRKSKSTEMSHLLCFW